jgi:hypothetical protein
VIEVPVSVNHTIHAGAVGRGSIDSRAIPWAPPAHPGGSVRRRACEDRFGPGIAVWSLPGLSRCTKVAAALRYRSRRLSCLYFSNGDSR